MSTTIIAVIVGVFVVLDRIGLLDRLKITRPSSSAAIDELAVSDRQVIRLRTELSEAKERADKLALERTNEPVLKLLERVLRLDERVAGICEQTLTKLSSFNGSLKHIEEGLADATEAMHAVTGLIAELHNLPIDGPRGRNLIDRKAS